MGLRLRQPRRALIPLSALPDGIFSEVRSLQVLDLSHNALAAIPDGLFRGLGKLTNLNLSHHALTKLERGVFADLTAMRRLNLEYHALPPGRARRAATWCMSPSPPRGAALG